MKLLNLQLLYIVAMFVTMFTPQNATAFYSPNTGRWLSRDPINENGFVKLFANGQWQFMFNEEKILYAVWENDLINNLDKLGLQGHFGGGGIWPPSNPDVPLWPPQPPPYPHQTFYGCDDSLSSSDKGAISDAVVEAVKRLQAMADGTMQLPSGGTRDMANCLLNHLKDNITIFCLGKCNPVCWFFDGVTVPSPVGEVGVCIDKIKGQGGNVANTINLMIFHEECHACGKFGHGNPDDPNVWAAILTVVLATR
jgi:hypothetical protein